MQGRLAWEKNELMDEEMLRNRKQAWVDREKKKFPLDYPEAQPEVNE